MTDDPVLRCRHASEGFQSAFRRPRLLVSHVCAGLPPRILFNPFLHKRFYFPKSLETLVEPERVLITEAAPGECP
jgi:hypothetical protein